jgi:hypothetical protein
MPWWAFLYLGLFAALAVAGVWGDHERRPAWFLTCAVLSNLAVVCFFVGFWRPMVRVPLIYVAPIDALGFEN